ncbi:SufD family Fe-S cluster assembly protein [Limosilactobacillus fermentum]
MYRPNYHRTPCTLAVVEANVLKDAYCRYTTIQTGRITSTRWKPSGAAGDDHATMEWVDGNLGSKVTMKHPSVYLDGEGAKGTMLSIAVASNGIHQDSGPRMIHNAKTPPVRSLELIARDRGSTDYRGTVRFTKNAQGSKAHVECDTIIMDDQSKSDTIPYNEINCSNVAMEHEAKVSKISEEQLYYLISRGISEERATEMIIMGFVEPFTKQLPMEYAVELNRLISFEMEGSIG